MKETKQAKAPAKPDAKTALKQSVKETSKVQPTDGKLPKGVIDPPEPEPEPGKEPKQPKPEPEPKPEPKPKGRTPRDFKAEYERKKAKLAGTSDPEPKQQHVKVDIITPALNGLIVPLVAKRSKRKAADIMLKPEQQEQLSKLLPDIDWLKPSWPAYFVLAISMITMNIYAAEEIKPDMNQLRKVQQGFESATRQSPPPQPSQNGSANHTNGTATEGTEHE